MPQPLHEGAVLNTQLRDLRSRLEQKEVTTREGRHNHVYIVMDIIIIMYKVTC
jgi:hypothetical protein